MFQYEIIILCPQHLQISDLGAWDNFSGQMSVYCLHIPEGCCRNYLGSYSMLTALGYANPIGQRIYANLLVDEP